MRTVAVVAVLALLSGCAALVGQPSITVDELLRIMEAQRSAGCLDGFVAGAGIGQVHLAVVWGESPPECGR